VSLHPFGSRHRHGFSLIEMLVVMGITAVLTALLLPTLSSIRENANRVISSSNQRNIGHGLIMYGSDHRDNLPESMCITGPNPAPSELMLARRDNPGRADSPYGKQKNVSGLNLGAGWDGLGRIYALHYLDTPETFYCPSHAGEHPKERYLETWDSRSGTIYTNYHYAGHINWETGEIRSFHQGHRLVLLTDGLRRRSDLNHRTGLNILRGDGSVQWKDLPTLLARLPIDDPVGDEIRDHHELIHEIFNTDNLVD
jgi:prepilin-type N-terminal cleavage/methylation domain-containing protein